MLFIHDHTFLKHGDSVYTTGSLNQKIMNRYLQWFGDVSVFATTRPINLDSDEQFIQSSNQVDNIDFHLVQKSHSPLKMIKYARMIDEAISSADSVVVRMSIFGAIGVHYARKRNVPYLIEMVACPWDSLWYHGIKGKLVAPWMTLLTKNLCRKAPFVLYVTNKFLQHRYPTNGVAVGCSDVDLPTISDQNLEKRLARIQLNSNSNSLRLVTVANVEVRYKGQETVIRSIPKLRRLGINPDYYLVGAGDNSRLKKLAVQLGVEDSVHFMGPKSHDEVFTILDSMDVYVQPSFQEGLPRAVVEAMSMACPVIGSTTGGIPELLDKNFVFRKGDVAGFVNIVSGMNSEAMTRQARRNFLFSKNYEATHLEKIRTAFYTDFRKSATKDKD